MLFRAIFDALIARSGIFSPPFAEGYRGPHHDFGRRCLDWPATFQTQGVGTERRSRWGLSVCNMDGRWSMERRRTRRKKDQQCRGTHGGEHQLGFWDSVLIKDRS
jgi:hypothetical protein